MLAKLQLWLFEKGSKKEHFTYERLGNTIQVIRTKLSGKYN